MNKGIFDLVEKIQKERPGWRFLLLGGDVQFAYKRNKKGRIVGTNKKEKQPFGWTAEFFGDIDPTKDTRSRHAKSGYYLRMEDAVIIACSMARKVIEEEKKKKVRVPLGSEGEK